jgi:type IV pilus assembly protein PilE
MRDLRKTARGFTLIELMIVVVVIAILAAIAYPSYQDQVLKTRRAEGKAALLDTAQQLERCFTRFGQYNHPNCSIFTSLPINDYEFYTISAVVAITPSTFRLAATPKGPQVKDTRCGELRLRHTAGQGSQGVDDADANNCW